MTFFSDLLGFSCRDHALDARDIHKASGSVSSGMVQDTQRRRLMAGGAALGLGMALVPLSGRAQQSARPPVLEADPAEVKRVIAEFLQGADPVEKGLKLELPFLGDNPASVPVRAIIDEPITPDSYCEELIVIAEGNPRPLACRFHFTPLVGNVDVAVRLRLVKSQSVRVMARMNDGRVLAQAQQITVTAGGCGM